MYFENRYCAFLSVSSTLASNRNFICSHYKGISEVNGIEILVVCLNACLPHHVVPYLTNSVYLFVGIFYYCVYSIFYILLTASVWIGWIANRMPAMIAKLYWRPATIMQTLVNNTQTMACIKIFVKWNQIGFNPNK